MKSYKSIIAKKIKFQSRQFLMDKQNNHYYLISGQIPEYNGWLEIGIKLINGRKKYYDNYGNEYRLNKNSIYAIY